MSHDHEITVNCPRCSSEMVVGVSVSGGEAPSRWHPGESPTVESDAPDGCYHAKDLDPVVYDLPEDGVWTAEEQKQLDESIEEAALSAHADSQYDPRWDGPEDDR